MLRSANKHFWHYCRGWIQTPFLVVVLRNTNNKPTKDMSRWRVASLLRPRWKWCRRTWSGKERFGPSLMRFVNLAQAAPRVSSFYWKVRIIFKGQQFKKEGRKQDKICLEVHPNFHEHLLWYEHTIVLLFPKGRMKTISIWGSHVSCQKYVGKSTVAQNPKGGYKGFHPLA